MKEGLNGSPSIAKPENKENNLEIKVMVLLSEIRNDLVLISESVEKMKDVDTSEEEFKSNLYKIISSCKDSIDLISFSLSKEELHSIRGIIHDIKNKFNHIYGFSQVIRDDYALLSKEEIIDDLKIIEKSTKEAIEDISKLLEDFDKQELGMEEVKMLNLELSDFLVDFIHISEKEAKNKGINLINKIEKNTNIVSDPKILMSVLENLMSNAIKFTQKGGEIIISSSHNGDYIDISIKDNGVGISKDKIDNFFESRETTLGTNREKGTGVGMNDSKENMTKINSNIKVESGGENKGSTFTISLPKG